MLGFLAPHTGMVIIYSEEHHHKIFHTEVHHDNYKYISARTKGIFKWRFGRQYKSFF